MEYTKKEDVLKYIDQIRKHIEDSKIEHFQLDINRGVKRGNHPSGFTVQKWDGSTSYDLTICLQDSKVPKVMLPEDFE